MQNIAEGMNVCHISNDFLLSKVWTEHMYRPPVENDNCGAVAYQI